MKSLDERIHEDGITMSIVHKGCVDLSQGRVDEWSVTFHREGRTLDVSFTGSVNDYDSAHTPSAVEVFESCVMDAISVSDNSSFVEWLSDHFSDSESIQMAQLKEEWESYTSLLRLHSDMQSFLGKELLREYLYNTDL